MKNADFDDVEDFDSGEDTEFKPKVEALTAAFSSFGFQWQESRDKNCFEFAKMYSDPTGKVSRLIIFVKKDAVGLEPENVDYFILTTQSHIEPTEEGIKRNAPDFCKEDLFRALEFFDTPDAKNFNDMSECSLCGLRTSEFVRIQASKFCRDCATRKGAKL